MGNCGRELGGDLGSCMYGQFSVDLGFIKGIAHWQAYARFYKSYTFFIFFAIRTFPHLYVRKNLVWILCAEFYKWGP